MNPYHCHAEQFIPHPLLLFRQLCGMILLIAMDSKAASKIVWILISWLLQKPADPDLHLYTGNLVKQGKSLMLEVLD